MKKTLALSLALILSVALFTSCSSKQSSNNNPQEEKSNIIETSMITNSESNTKDDSESASEIEETVENEKDNDAQTNVAQSESVVVDSIDVENEDQINTTQSDSTEIESENNETVETSFNGENTQYEDAINEEANIDDPAWDELENLGKVQTEQGIIFVKITIPSDLVGEDVAQESIDANAGDTYTSGVLNEDGSVTYTLTKKQHKEMLDGITKGMEDSFQEMLDDPEIAVSKIDYNKDMTIFDVYLTTEELGLNETFLAYAFYMYGGIYSLFSGHDNQNITVNYYSVNGELINTGNSSEMEG